MGILIGIGIVIASLIVLFLLVAACTKKDFSVERTIVVNKSTAEVFNYLKFLKNQEKYSVWVMKDPNIQLIYTGTDGTPGATSSWQSNDKNVGVGAQEIKKIVENESIEVEVRFKKPFEATNYALTTLTALADNQTKVSNLFYGTSKFPMNVMNLVMDKMIGRDIQQNLTNVKNNVEA